MNEIPTPRMHSMACNFPEGCSCGAADYNRLLDQLTTAREKLDATEKERDKAVEKFNKYGRVLEATAVKLSEIPDEEAERMLDTLNQAAMEMLETERDAALAELAKVKAELQQFKEGKRSNEL